MARTKSSRGKEPFQMRSGNNTETGTPYPFLKGLKNIGKKIVGATPIGMAAKALKGGNDSGSATAGAMGGADDVNTKIDEIHSALVGEEGDTMMTKKTPYPTNGNNNDEYVIIDRPKRYIDGKLVTDEEWEAHGDI
jgi:hypothetical protein